MTRSTIVLTLLTGCMDYDVFGDLNYPDGSETCELEGVPAVEVGINDACDVELQTGSFTPVVEWELAGHNGLGPPAVAQIDDDNGDGVIDSGDIPDVMYMTMSEGVVAVDGRTGSLKWMNPEVSSYSSGVAVADLDGDGVPEIIAGVSPNVAVLNNRGDLIWESPELDQGVLHGYLFPAVADMDADGVPEIIAGRNILDIYGNVIGVGDFGVGGSQSSQGEGVHGSLPAVVDLDDDGILEVVTGNAAYNKDGSTKYSNGGIDGVPAIADFDGDGEPEIVVSSRDMLWTLESDMTPTGWSVTFPTARYLGAPAADDLDGDGLPEIVAVGGGELRVYHWGGELMWAVAVEDISGAAGPILFDFDSDGYPEVVYADEVKVRVFNGLDGSIKMESNDHQSTTGYENPVVADVDNDGEVEIIMCHGAGPSGLTVYGDADHTWPEGRQIWNQHNYSITNINDDASIPTPQEPNHLIYNNYRSANTSLTGSRWRDLEVEVVESCYLECPDMLVVVARVLNRGTQSLDPGVGIVVRAGYGGPVVASVSTPETIRGGWSSEGIEIRVLTDSLGDATPVVEVDRDANMVGHFDECVEENNTDIAESCPG